MSEEGARAEHLVVLLHGLGRGRASMTPLARRLRREGYRVANLGYPSMRAGLDDHVARVQARLDAVEGPTRVSFVTHSLGGIIARALLAEPSAWSGRMEPFRAVMLAPPNQGSAFAEALHRRVGIERLLGPALLDVVHRAAALPEPSIEVGVIAGSLRRGRGLNPLLPGDDDAIVRVDETRLASAADFAVMPAVHTFIMLDRRVHAAIIHFLATGSFGLGSRAGAEAAAGSPPS